MLVEEWPDYAKPPGDDLVAESSQALAEESPPDEPLLNPCITFNAMQGRNAPSTLRFTDSIFQHTVTILVDSGSTHNFLQTRLAKHLKMEVEPTMHMNVIIGNGDSMLCAGLCREVPIHISGHIFSADLHLLLIFGADIVLGAQWLSSLGPTTFLFQDLWMGFVSNGVKVRLLGVSRPHTPSHMSFHQLMRATSTGSISDLFQIMIHQPDPTSPSAPPHTISLTLAPSIPQPYIPSLQSLLQQFAKVFSPARGLPPSL